MFGICIIYTIVYKSKNIFDIGGDNNIKLVPMTTVKILINRVNLVVPCV